MAKACAECGVEVTHDRHRFVDDSRSMPGVPSKVVKQYCDHHCPRCEFGDIDANE